MPLMSSTTSGQFLVQPTQPSTNITGAIWYDSQNNILYYNLNGVYTKIVDLSTTQTLTGKTINSASNTITLAASVIPNLTSTYANKITIPSNPAGTTSTTAVMTGLATSFITKRSGKVIIIINATAFSDTLNGQVVSIAAYGTGTAPVNGAGAVGTQVGNINYTTKSAVANDSTGISLGGYVTGLDTTGATTYWLDIQFYSDNVAKTANISSITVTVFELP